jgi:hypothetical protein
MPAMPRPPENTRLRRLLMQGVLCAGLGLSLALAWWIGRIHAAALTVQLGAPQSFQIPGLDLDLNVRLPVGWKIERTKPSIRNPKSAAILVEPTDVEKMIVATESEKAYGTQRTLIIHIQPVDASMSPEIAVSKLADDRIPKGGPGKVEILGTPGIFVEYPLETLGTVPDSEGRSMTQINPTLLIACAVIPGPQPTLVAVELHGVFTSAPADFDLVRSVAKSLAHSDPKHPAPPISD